MFGIGIRSLLKPLGFLRVGPHCLKLSQPTINVLQLQVGPRCHHKGLEDGFSVPLTLESRYQGDQPRSLPPNWGPVRCYEPHTYPGLLVLAHPSNWPSLGGEHNRWSPWPLKVALSMHSLKSSLKWLTVKGNPLEGKLSRIRNSP